MDSPGSDLHLSGAGDKSLPPAIFLMGPTASGKTELAIQLCEHYPCEIISVDSALVYRQLNIGSAKPSAEELARAPHRLIDILDPAESYSAAEFRRDALREMAEISARGKIPLLVGGTMLYFKALYEGLAALPAADPKVRADIEGLAAAEGWPAVHAELAAVDPESAARIHPNHSRRLARALEVYRVSGLTMTEHHRRQHLQRPPYRIVQLAIAPDERPVLHRRIEKRFQQMLELGFVEEVRQLQLRSDLHRDLPAIRAVGYRQVWEYLVGELSEAEMLERGVIATRQLAKRQFTWLRSWPELQWLLTDEAGQLLKTRCGDNEDSACCGQPPLTQALKILASDLSK